MTRPIPVRAAALAALAALAACKDSTPPADPDRIVNVFVGTQVDSATLRNEGEFVLSLVPVNGRGQVVINNISVVPAVESSTLSANLVGTPQVVPPDPRPIAAAVNLDNSRSMLTSDPDRRRVTAARQFWGALLESDLSNQASLLGFGVEGATEGFTVTHLFQTWTNSAATLDAAFDGVTSIGESPLYGSTREIVSWIDSTRSPESAYRRIIVVFTDALPDDPAAEAALLTAAQARSVTIHAVGLGPASDQSDQTIPEAVARLTRIANATGGVYAGAPSAGALPTVFSALARITKEGALLATVRLDPAPPVGTVVNGTVRVSNQAGGATGNWTVTVK